MRFISYFILIALFAFTGCKSYKNELYRRGGVQEALENGITIFENESKIAKSHNSKWIADIYTIDLDTIYSDQSEMFYRLSFMPFDQPWYKHPWIVEGSDAIYSDFIINGDRAYVWNNPEKKITEELLDVYRKYNAMDESWFEEEYGDIVKDFPKEKWPSSGLLAPTIICETTPREEIIISGSDLTEYSRTYICSSFKVSFFKKLWIKIKRLLH